MLYKTYQKMSARQKRFEQLSSPCPSSCPRPVRIQPFHLPVIHYIKEIGLKVCHLSCYWHHCVATMSTHTYAYHYPLFKRTKTE